MNPARRITKSSLGVEQYRSIGEVLRGSTLPNGLELRQQRVPLGVVGMVYEARPNVTVDAFGLTLKSGNAALLRGSSSAVKSNEALVAALRASLVAQGLPEDSVQLLPSADRSLPDANSTRRRPRRNRRRVTGSAPPMGPAIRASASSPVN